MVSEAEACTRGRSSSLGASRELRTSQQSTTLVPRGAASRNAHWRSTDRLQAVRVRLAIDVLLLLFASRCSAACAQSLQLLCFHVVLNTALVRNVCVNLNKCDKSQRARRRRRWRLCRFRRSFCFLCRCRPVSLLPFVSLRMHICCFAVHVYSDCVFFLVRSGSLEEVCLWSSWQCFACCHCFTCQCLIRC